MTTSGVYKPPPLPLDESLYTIDDAALGYMQAQTGILDPEELKKHIIAAQAEAYAVCAASVEYHWHTDADHIAVPRCFPMVVFANFPSSSEFYVFH